MSITIELHESKVKAVMHALELQLEQLYKIKNKHQQDTYHIVPDIDETAVDNYISAIDTEIKFIHEIWTIFQQKINPGKTALELYQMGSKTEGV